MMRDRRWPDPRELAMLATFGRALGGRLWRAGFMSAEQLHAYPDADLPAVPSFGPHTARLIRDALLVWHIGEWGGP